jgi:hypothetical protein
MDIREMQRAQNSEHGKSGIAVVSLQRSERREREIWTCTIVKGHGNRGMASLHPTQSSSVTVPAPIRTVMVPASKDRRGVWEL